jgi:hypothetical protein
MTQTTDDTMDRPGWVASDEGKAEGGRDFDPRAPECDEDADKRSRGPVTHGTPLGPDEYARLKEKAQRGGPGDRGGPAQDDR